MQTSLTTVMAEAVALPYEDRVELLAVLAKSISKSALDTSKKNEQNWGKMLDLYTGCMGGLCSKEDPVEYQRNLREDRVID